MMQRVDYTHKYIGDLYVLKQFNTAGQVGI